MGCLANLGFGIIEASMVWPRALGVFMNAIYEGLLMRAPRVACGETLCAGVRLATRISQLRLCKTSDCIAPRNLVRVG